VVPGAFVFSRGRYQDPDVPEFVGKSRTFTSYTTILFLLRLLPGKHGDKKPTTKIFV
jgi:hypothetical protein